MAVAALNNIPTFNNFAAILAQDSTDPAISSDVFRQAVQSQDNSQTSRAFSGAQTTNSFTANADLSQNASADNNKDITINAASGTGTDTDLAQPRHTGIILGGPLRGSAVTTFLQDQGGNQDSFANQTDAQGNPSRAGNSLDLAEQLNSTLNSNINTTVNAPTTFTGDQPQITFVAQGSDTNPRIESLLAEEEEEEPKNVFGSLSLPTLASSSLPFSGASSPAAGLPVFTPFAPVIGAFPLNPGMVLPSFIPQFGGITGQPVPAFTSNLLNVFA
jgi:hypothetical protein